MNKFNWHYHKITALLVIGFMLASCGGGGGGGGSSPDNSGPIRHRIFVSSMGSDGNLGGLVGADIFCTTAAANAGIAGSYRAIMSSLTEPANTRLTISGEVYMKSGGGDVTVFAAGADFWNSAPQTAINIDENEMVTNLLVSEEPWTGTDPIGGIAAATTCSDWTTASNLVTGVTGNTHDTSASNWVNDNGWTCDDLRRLYCIEE